MGERRRRVDVRRQHQVRERSHRLKRARLGSFTAAASDPRSGTLFVTPELWSAASTLCRLQRPPDLPGTTIAYTVSEMSVVGRPMLDFSNGQTPGP